ncbi:MAG: DUF4159 domain-containing protein [Polyangiaceae bacterium]|nr:DUF4159 domain-containing protein [Polyangiaceae bacterium]
MRIARQSFLLGLAASVVSPKVLAFGQAGAFHPRVLITGAATWAGPRVRAPERWGWELVRRTSAPARAVCKTVRAIDGSLFAEPFCIWVGEGDFPPLSRRELRQLGRFIALGGVMLVDDFDPAGGAFGRAARRELRRVLPESPPVRLDPRHVLFKTYYILERPFGRVLGVDHVDAIVRGNNAQVLFLNHDLLGALAQDEAGNWAFETESPDPMFREQAARLAVNIAMYVLCSDYKDDQVHAPFLMRRRAAR